MSVTAIAAALAREDLSAGERLVMFSLASFANRENRAWPGAPAAAARAGLSRSRYLQARDQLARRGLVVVENTATGRGRASTLPEVRRRGPLVGARDQRAAVRGGADVQPRSRPSKAATGNDGCARERGTRHDRPHDRASVQRCRARRQELPACAPSAARIRRADAAQRRRRAREREPLGALRPAAARRRVRHVAGRSSRPSPGGRTTAGRSGCGVRPCDERRVVRQL